MAETKAKKPAKEKVKTEKAPKAAKKVSTQQASSAPKTIKFQDYVICQKRSGRYEVLTNKGKNINGPDKSKILIDAKLVSAGTPKAAEKKEEAPPAAAT